AVALTPAPLCAQSAQDQTELDPSAPLEPMPDLGIEWPDITQPDVAPPPEIKAVPPEAAAESTEEAAEKIEDTTATRSYRWTISGMEGLPEASDVRIGFDERSVLRGDRNKTANAAQIDRRARADAELLAELLRSQGYYDAGVQPTIGAAGDELIVQLAATRV